MAKVKFNVNRVDNMVIQAIILLDTLDKAVNSFVMRVREWYGWHFSELVKIINDNYLYAKVAIFIVNKSELSEAKLSALTPRLISLVGEMVVARLISHAGSLTELAKCPTSTLQIVGAEKALFRLSAILMFEDAKFGKKKRKEKHRLEQEVAKEENGVKEEGTAKKKKQSKDDGEYVSAVSKGKKKKRTIM